jgi:hypothetical protein
VSTTVWQRALIILALIGLSLALLWRYLVWSPLWDEGPFRGSPVADVSGLVRAQTIELWGGRRLHVFERRASDLAPVVVLDAPDRKRQWAIVASGRGDCVVNWIRFRDYSRLWISPRVIGTVDWNCGGREKTVWYLDHHATLKEYWYSW